MPGPTTIRTATRFTSYKYEYSYKKSPVVCLIFNSLFLQLPNNHLIASSRLHLCFRASDEMIGWMYVKLLAALILCKSNSKVRVCWKQAKQQTTLEEIKRLCAATSNVLLLNFHHKITNFWFFKNDWLCEETLTFLLLLPQLLIV